mmetsp:Transcript_30863/g.45639  ORF Transcript_30863/g.45639 Transcript_30863/m.45639 type:complete len:128 (+) Transcript_30863:1460-1843(+)
MNCRMRYRSIATILWEHYEPRRRRRHHRVDRGNHHTPIVPPIAPTVLFRIQFIPIGIMNRFRRLMMMNRFLWHRHIDNRSVWNVRLGNNVHPVDFSNATSEKIKKSTMLVYTNVKEVGLSAQQTATS